MKKLKLLMVVGVVSVLLLAWAGTASAHFLYIETEVNPEIPAEQEVKVLFGHPTTPEGCYVYPEMEYARVYKPDGTTVELNLKKESGYRTAQQATYWTTEVTLDQEGDYFIVAERAPLAFDPMWHEHPGPVELRYEWAKVVVHGGGEEQWHKAVGLELEIVPLVNPYDLQVGDTFIAKLLYNGEPVKGEYVASHETENIHDPEVAQVGETTEDGTFSIYISKPGMWGLMATHDIEGSGTWTATWDHPAFFKTGDQIEHEIVKNQTTMTVWASLIGPASIGPVGPQGPQGSPGPAGGGGWAYAAFAIAIVALLIAAVSLALKRR